MKFIVDTEKLLEHELSVDELLYLLSLYFRKAITEDTIKNVKKKGMTLQYTEGHIPPFKLTYKGSQVVNGVFLTSEFGGSEKKPERFEILADKLREIYPKGLKPGTNCMWRDSKAVIANRLKALVKKYNAEFTDEEAIDATKRYVASFNGNYTYMQILKYFISKQKPIEGAPAEQNSQFLSFLENKEGSDVVINQDWTVNLV